VAECVSRRRQWHSAESCLRRQRQPPSRRGLFSRGAGSAVREQSVSQHWTDAPQHAAEAGQHQLHLFEDRSSDQFRHQFYAGEFLDHIAPLTDPVNHGGKAEDAFDVVIPSLPGFAFSGPTKEAGWNNARIGKALIELMGRLGYDKFALQGGDAGAVIGPDMGRLAPEKFIGLHLNAATMGFIPMGPVDEADLAQFTPAEKKRLEVLQEFVQVKFGFNLLQSNQPQLVGYALSDSPLGLMAWMTQLMDPAEVGEERFLTNFMIYWLTGTGASCIRWYYESAHDPSTWAPKANSGVPTAVAVFQDGDIAIRKYGEGSKNIVRWTEYPHGGHYAALTVPEVWLNDVREFFRELR